MAQSLSIHEVDMEAPTETAPPKELTEVVEPSGPNQPPAQSDPFLVDRWTSRLKNNKLIAILIILGMAVGGVATFTEKINKTYEWWVKLHAPPPPPSPPPPPPVLHPFKESFTLGHGQVKSSHGFFVRVEDVGWRNNFEFMSVAVSFMGDHQYFNESDPFLNKGFDTKEVKEGEVISVLSTRCQTVKIAVTLIEPHLIKGITWEQWRAMSPYKRISTCGFLVTFEISGLCPE